MFYVNGKLKHIIDDFDEIIARRLKYIIKTSQFLLISL
jgi:hypothetical protein